MSEWQVVNGDSLEILKQLPDACVDSLVSDPPAGIGFMGKTWDQPGVMGTSGGLAMPATTSSRNPSCRTCGGRKRAGAATKACTCEAPDWNDLEYRLRDRDSFVSFMESVMREALRVLKPGAHGVVWALPRTSHWTATALEQAGFEVRDVITHHFGTGFPKSLNVSKAIDEAAGATREKVGRVVYRENDSQHTSDHLKAFGAEEGTCGRSWDVTAPATEAAKQWDGWGTALKPASEHWILVRKPLAGTVAANVQEYGTGALNIDATRIDASGGRPGRVADSGNASAGGYNDGLNGSHVVEDTTLGRWPANLVLSHTEWCEPLDAAGAVVEVDDYGDASAPIVSFQCLPGCPVALLDAQSGPTKPGGTIGAHTASAAAPDGRTVFRKNVNARGAWEGHGDKGGASRFFYVSKPSTKEREEGLAHLPKKSGGEIVDRAEDSAGINNPRAGAGRTAKGRANFHPTVKSIGLMTWLVTLISPPGGVVLDPFCGSGSTGVAAVKGGWSFLGIEKDPEYVPIAEARIGHANGEAAALVESPAALTSPALVPDAIIPPGALLCMVCHEPQFDTPSGICCSNGHGGALSTSVHSLTAA